MSNDWTNDWTAEVVGRMHSARITGQQLAEECGYSAAYLSSVLNSKKPDPDQTKDRIFQALERLEKAAMSCKEGEANADE